MKLARLALQRHLLHADPRERQRERTDNRLQGGRLGGRDAPKAPGGPLGPSGSGPQECPSGRGTEHDRAPALTQTLRAEKGGKRHEMPAHHKLEAFLDEYVAAAGIREDGKSPLFRTALGQTGRLGDEAMHRLGAYRMIRRRTTKTGFRVKLGCHVFRATGITAYLEAGGRCDEGDGREVDAGIPTAPDGVPGGYRLRQRRGGRYERCDYAA
jgi:hypothetical protein